jgi:hypothetical protein
MIWALQFQPRRVAIMFCSNKEEVCRGQYSDKEIHDMQRRIEKSTPLPTTLAINKESREYTLENYTVLSRNGVDIASDKTTCLLTPDQFFVVNLKVDTVYLSYCCVQTTQWQIFNQRIKAFRSQISKPEDFVGAIQRLEITNLEVREFKDPQWEFVERCTVLESPPGFILFDRNFSLCRVLVFRGLKELHLRFYDDNHLTAPSQSTSTFLTKNQRDSQVAPEFETAFQKFLERHKQLFKSGQAPIVTAELGPPNPRPNPTGRTPQSSLS